MADGMMSIGARLAQLARVQPNKVAVIVDNQSLSYAALHARTNRLARKLRELGVTAGDLVTIGLPNGFEFVEACWSVWKLGATPQPVSFRLPQPELEAILRLAGSTLVIGDFPFDPSVRQLGQAGLSAESYPEADLPDVTAPVLKAPTSGGSTGQPKLILSGAPGETAADWRETFNWQMTPETIALMPAPLYHNAGFGMMLAALNTGATLVLMPRFEARQTLAELARAGATWVYLVPTMMNRIWQLGEAERSAFDLSRLGALWHLAAPCPPWLKEAFIDWLGPDTILELYAGTESQAATVITGREWLNHRGSVGRVSRGEMRAFDEAGVALSPGTVGEIYMRWSPGTAQTYRYLGAEAKTLPGGWESIGDLGWFDEEGYLYLADRRTDMVLIGGANVYPAEVEGALERHPSVLSCAVIGIPEEDLGNRLHAIVHATNATEESLRRHADAQLAPYKRPRSYEFVDYALRDDAGKVRRGVLRAARL